ncbi:hypothetical protein GQ43DRAFT_388969 [Delitschia confertaspora ATCC 74209]|uniref:Uncharacterized protein n=1 Tax=Delitschia confertaspora ATCC 74209 TaxID=1513339 RepID=A0A9P4JT68_9PLEO|nr:hypothetical protein GQ43DRAFT_388969 [Delitschia confertaspora ATCC 74209]
MNTVKSVYYGWGTLIVAGAGAYYFAKKSINADRATKAEADRQKRLRNAQLEAQALSPSSLPKSSSQSSTPLSTSSHYTFPPPTNTGPAPTNTTTSAAPKSITDEVGKLKRNGGNGGWNGDSAGDPSLEASQDPAPTRHAPEDEVQKVREKSKYEASDVYRSRKGDRFS